MNPSTNNQQPSTSIDWKHRLEEQRESEWKARCELLGIATKIIEGWDLDNFDKIPPDLALKFISASSEMGRLAIEGVKEMPDGATEQGEFLRDLESALVRIRGDQTNDKRQETRN